MANYSSPLVRKHTISGRHSGPVYLNSYALSGLRVDYVPLVPLPQLVTFPEHFSVLNFHTPERIDLRTENMVLEQAKLRRKAIAGEVMSSQQQGLPAANGGPPMPPVSNIPLIPYQNTTILTPVPVHKDSSSLSASASDTSMDKPLGEMSLKDFEGDSDPFEATALQAIDVLSELQSVLQPTPLQQQPAGNNASPTITTSHYRSQTASSPSLYPNPPLSSSAATISNSTPMHHHYTTGNATNELLVNITDDHSSHKQQATNPVTPPIIPRRKTPVNSPQIPPKPKPRTVFPSSCTTSSNTTTTSTTTNNAQSIPLPPYPSQAPPYPSQAPYLSQSPPYPSQSLYPQPSPPNHPPPNHPPPNHPPPSHPPPSTSLPQYEGPPASVYPPISGPFRGVPVLPPIPPISSNVLPPSYQDSSYPTSTATAINHEASPQLPVVAPHYTGYEQENLRNTTGMTSFPSINQNSSFYPTTTTTAATTTAPANHFISSRSPVVAPRHKDYSLPDVSNSLSHKEQDSLRGIAGMGFPSTRVARALKRFEGDDQKVFDFLLLVGKLEEKGFNGDSCETALLAHEEDIDKSLSYLNQVKQYQEVWPEVKIHEAYQKAGGDWDQTIDILTQGK